MQCKKMDGVKKWMDKSITPPMKNYKSLFYNERTISEKNDELLKLMCKWMSAKRNGIISSYFTERNYYEIAIYGYNDVSKCFHNELIFENAGVTAKYAIDRNANIMVEPIEIYLPTDELPKVDAIVVTAITFYYDIYIFLTQYGIKYPIISLDEIIYYNNN